MSRPDFPEHSLMVSFQEKGPFEHELVRPFEDSVKARYTADELPKVYDEFAISEEQQGPFRHFLVHAGCLYMSHEQVRRESTPPVELRRELRLVSSRTRKLREALDDLSPEGGRRLWECDLQAHAHIHPHSPTSPFGHRANVVEIEENAWKIFWLGQEKILEALEVLENYSLSTLERIPPPKRGRPDLGQGLRMWIINAEAFWTMGLGREFTNFWKGGSPVSEAAQFCCRLLTLLDPDLPASSIETEMKEWVSTARERARKNAE